MKFILNENNFIKKMEFYNSYQGFINPPYTRSTHISLCNNYLFLLTCFGLKRRSRLIFPSVLRIFYRGMILCRNWQNNKRLNSENDDK